jgi:hypothetical protein
LKRALRELAKSFHATPRLSAGESVATARFKVKLLKTTLQLNPDADS